MKKNKIVNKIGILVLAVMLSILSSITVLASEPEEAELGPRQDINKIFYADVVGDYIGIDREEKDKNVFILAEMPQEAISPCLLSEP